MLKEIGLLVGTMVVSYYVCKGITVCVLLKKDALKAKNK